MIFLLPMKDFSSNRYGMILSVSQHLICLCQDRHQSARLPGPSHGHCVTPHGALKSARKHHIRAIFSQVGERKARKIYRDTYSSRCLWNIIYNIKYILYIYMVIEKTNTNTEIGAWWSSGVDLKHNFTSWDYYRLASWQWFIISSSRITLQEEIGSFFSGVPKFCAHRYHLILP